MPSQTGRRLGWVIIIAFCAAFTVQASGDLDTPFGFHTANLSADDYNNAVWSTGARAIRESGPLASKLGAVWSTTPGDGYANHPPAIYSLTSLAQWLVGNDELAARMLALAASLLSVALLFLLMCELGLGPALSAASVCVGLSVPIFLTYGTMLDTWILALPLAVGHLLCWLRSLDRRPRVLLAGLTALALCLVAWEGVILVAVTTLSSVVLHRGRGVRALVVAPMIGGFCALTMTALWMLWVHGSLAGLLDQAVFRAGGGFGMSFDESVEGQVMTFSLGTYLERQWFFLEDLLGIPGIMILAVGMVALLAVRRYRLIGLAAAGTSLLYAGTFREGSFHHDYWNYWIVIPLVVGIGALASSINRLRGSGRPRPRLATAGCLLVLGSAVALMVVGFIAEPSTARHRTTDQQRIAEETPLRNPVSGRTWVPVVGAGGEPGWAGWGMNPVVRYYFHAPLRFATAEQAAAYVARYPDAWIVLNNQAVPGQVALAHLNGRP